MHTNASDSKISIRLDGATLNGQIRMPWWSSAPGRLDLRRPTAHRYADMRNAEHYGGHSPIDIRVNFPAIMERMRRIRARLSRAESVHRLKAAGVDVFFGHATFSGTAAL